MTESGPTATTSIIPVPSTILEPEIKNGSAFYSVVYFYGTLFLISMGSPVNADSSAAISCPAIRIPSTDII